MHFTHDNNIFIRLYFSQYNLPERPPWSPSASSFCNCSSADLSLGGNKTLSAVSTSYTVLIIEDEPVQQLLLTDWLGFLPELTLVGCTGSAKEGLQILREKPVDILLLDIYLPDLTGLNLIKSLPRLPKIILQTSSLDHAVEGFDIGVVDYLVKPYSFDRFSKAIQRAVELLATAQSAPAPPPAPESKNHHEFVFLRVGKDLKKIAISDILYAVSMQNYTRLHFVNNEEAVALISLRRLHEQLGLARFFRTHKSYLVNLANIESLSGNEVRLGDQTVPLASTHRHALEAAWIKTRIIAR